MSITLKDLAKRFGNDYNQPKRIVIEEFDLDCYTDFDDFLENAKKFKEKHADCTIERVDEYFRALRFETQEEVDIRVRGYIDFLIKEETRRVKKEEEQKENRKKMYEELKKEFENETPS